jgi:hypothetical protein
VRRLQDKRPENPALIPGRNRDFSHLPCVQTGFAVHPVSYATILVPEAMEVWG